MSKQKPAAQPLPETFEPDRFYAVELARPTSWLGRDIRPGMDLELRGQVCEALRADIAAAQLLPRLPE